VPLPLANPRTQVRERAAFTAIDASAPLALWHLASLDAPTVAVIWSLAFAWAARVVLPAWAPALLALAAWAVYIGDRLLDARAALRTGQLHRLRERHFFHHRHRRVFLVLAVVAACAAASIVLLLMPAGARERNSLLAAAAAVYFSCVHSRRRLRWRLTRVRFSGLSRLLSALLSKELLVGLLFTAGCVLPTLSRMAPAPDLPGWPLGAAAAYFSALAWLNCHAIERWETDALQGGQRETAPAAGVRFGPLSLARPFPAASLLALAGLLLASALFSWQPRPAALLAAGAASSLLLALLDRLQSRLTPLALRTAADLVLLTPLALLCR
jgi:hypothetical protein